MCEAQEKERESLSVTLKVSQREEKRFASGVNVKGPSYSARDSDHKESV